MLQARVLLARVVSACCARACVCVRVCVGFHGLRVSRTVCLVRSALCVRAVQMVLAHECEDEDKKESLMYQLQVMFANLQESEKMAYNPKGFCHALKVG